MNDIPNLWRKRQFISYLLYPFSLLFRLISTYRRHHLISKQDTPKRRTIVIGNITVGGNGKTPIVIALANALTHRGYQVAIVSRGYGGQSKIPKLVDRNSDVNESGDEPLLIAQETSVPVVTCQQRVQAIDYVITHFPDTQIIISDDGLQHYKMPRTQEYAVIAPDFLLGNGFCIPAGPLREPAQRLNEVDGVLYTGDIPHPFTNTAPHYVLNMHNEQFVFWNTQEPVHDLNLLNQCNVLTSIARPERFIRQLKKLGLNIHEQRLFADHYLFTESEAVFKDNPDAYIVMTSKDAIKTMQWSQIMRDKIVVLKYEAILPTSFIEKVLNKES